MAAPPVAAAISADMSNAVCTRHVGLIEFIKNQRDPINDRSFRDAIEQSLANNGLLASEPSRCRFVVDADYYGILFAMPSVGPGQGNLTVEYSVFSTEDDSLIYQETVRSSNDESANDVEDPNSNEGLKKFHEGIVRENLILFVTRFAQSQE